MDNATRRKVARSLLAAADVLASSAVTLAKLRSLVKVIEAMPSAKTGKPSTDTITVSQIRASVDGLAFRITFANLRPNQKQALKAMLEEQGLDIVESDITNGRYDWKTILTVMPKGSDFPAVKINPLD